MDCLPQLSAIFAQNPWFGPALIATIQVTILLAIGAFACAGIASRRVVGQDVE